MREIKFRAWDKEEKKIISPYQKEGENIFYFWRDFSPDRFEWMQYTGLKDKNGTEIYEGDLFMDEEDGIYNTVEWNENYGGWCTNTWFSVGEFGHIAKTLEVIGNIYENPELLDKNK